MKNLLLKLYYTALGILTIFIVWRLVSLHTSVDREKTIKNKFQTETIHANRGSIISADNHKLAFDVEKYQIKLDPQNIRADKRNKISDDEVFKGVILVLSENLNLDYTTIYNEILDLKNKGKRNYVFKELVDIETKNKILEEIKKITRNQIVFPKNFSIRHFSNEIDFKNIIGFINSEGKGVYGVESSYDEYLKGEDGEVKRFMPAAEVDSIKKATVPYIVEEKVIKEVKNGNDLHLTIDTIMQITLDDILKKAYVDNEAYSTMGILMEADTGKIIAMSSYPKTENLADLKNLNISDIFEPGSIFKPITVAAALNEKVVNKNTVIHSDGQISIKNVKKPIKDHDRSTVGDFTLAEMIAKSGNVAMVKVQQMFDRGVFYDYIEKFGFGKKTGIDANYESNYRLMKKEKFTEITAANVSFGQGIAITQIQMINALNATVNGGKLLKPYIVDYITDENSNVIKINKPVIVSNVISEETSKNVRELLEGVVNYGTGRNVAIKGYKIGGKTGTAQKAEGGKYVKGKYYSSFFTFFPTTKPKYSLLITVNEPKGVYYGAAVALPPAKEVLEKLIKYMGIKPDYIVEDETTNTTDNKKDKEVKKVKIDKAKINTIQKDLEKGIMPDFIGLSLKDVINLPNIDKYVDIEFIGNGNVFNQNIKGGEAITNSTKIILEFR